MVSLTWKWDCIKRDFMIKKAMYEPQKNAMKSLSYSGMYFFPNILKIRLLIL